MRPPARPDRERGIALMVALVMILLLSTLGVSAMRGATLESRLADNALHKELTFQAAESATDIVLAEDGLLASRIGRPALEDRTVPEANLAPGQRTTVTLVDDGPALLLDGSLGGPVAARRFIVSGESRLEALATSTRITQGVVIALPKGSTSGN